MVASAADVWSIFLLAPLLLQENHMLARIAFAATALAIAVSTMPSTSYANGYHRRHAVVATRASGDCFGIFTRVGHMFDFLRCAR